MCDEDGYSKEVEEADLMHPVSLSWDVGLVHNDHSIYILTVNFLVIRLKDVASCHESWKKSIQG